MLFGKEDSCTWLSISCLLSRKHCVKENLCGAVTLLVHYFVCWLGVLSIGGRKINHGHVSEVFPHVPVGELSSFLVLPNDMRVLTQKWAGGL